MFGFSVAISVNNAAIRDYEDYYRGSDSGSSFVYTNIDGKWIKNGKIFLEDSATDN